MSCGKRCRTWRARVIIEWHTHVYPPEAVFWRNAATLLKLPVADAARAA